MTETWLRANRRVLAWALIPAAGVTALGAALAATASHGALRGLGWAIAGLGALLALGLADQMRRPRIAFRDGCVLFNLRRGRPVETPVQFVEAFFLGQGPARLPAVDGKPAEAVNLVARISQKAPQWAEVDVKPALGRWCDGYVTIRGMWCEPLDGELIRRLNRRLREVRETATTPVAAAEAPRA